MKFLISQLALAGVWLLVGVDLQAQQCSATLCGTVLDSETGRPVAFAEIFIAETATGDVTDEAGRFHIHDICDGEYTVSCKHIGCPAVAKSIFISGNVEVDFELHHEAADLDEIIVREKAVTPTNTQAEQRLSGLELQAVQGQTLGDALTSLPGVNTLHTGSTIAKPVLQGLHSNRVLILNHGVRQEGQQWGLDHGPEIDPYLAGELKVVMGANSVRYGADALGGVILVEPKPLRSEPGVGGELNLAGFSNGWTGAVSGNVDGALKGSFPLQIRLQGTLKRGGNTWTPDYFLENTGVKESNASATVGLRKGKLNTEVFYSFFFTDIGIFEGAHIGNLTDLENAIERGRPMGDGSFSYELGRPAQRVAHHLLKAKSTWKLGQLGEVDMVYARQFNRRQEFDAHRPSGNLPQGFDQPNLEFEITTHTADLTLAHKPLRWLSGSLGLQWMQQVNTTDRGGLIPNYDNQTVGIFWVERWRKYPFPLELEAGLRYDFRSLNVDNRGNEVIDKSLDFDNWSGTFGAVYRISDRLKARLHIGSAWRAPTVSELYSDGVHHGSASYELGRDDLTSERALSTSLTFDFSLLQKENTGGLNASLTIYRNRIGDFIFLEPQEQPKLTIRGAFPSFRYTQTDAQLSGIDWNVDWRLAKAIGVGTGGSLLRAKDIETDDWLIFMPADRLKHSVTGYFGRGENTSVKLTMQNVFEQTRVPGGQDFTDPPAGYTLFGLEGSVAWSWGPYPIRLMVEVDNLLGRRYRSYLNRLRYYADEVGRTVAVRVHIDF